MIGREVTVQAGPWAPGDATVKRWRRPAGIGTAAGGRQTPPREDNAQGSRWRSHAAFTWPRLIATGRDVL